MGNHPLDAELGIPFADYASLALDVMRMSLLLAEILYMREDKYEP